MAAFEHAVSLGYRYLETDVQATADGVLVTFHDDELDRITDRVGRIGDLPWAEVRRARIAGSHAIPLLEDLLGTWPRVRVNIDPKRDAGVEPLVEVLRRTNSVSRVCVGSFSDRRLARVRRRLGPDLCTSLGPLGIARLKAAGWGVPTGRLPAACAQVPVATRRLTVLDRRLVHAAHRRGMQVHVWTIDHREEMARLLDLGVDGIITDELTTLRDLLIARGRWRGD